jgi:hypothetical protein
LGAAEQQQAPAKSKAKLERERKMQVGFSLLSAAGHGPDVLFRLTIISAECLACHC